MSAPMNCQLIGRWRIVEADIWDRDYLDLCGEPVWMRQMIDRHEAAAKASGARIVFSCGFDSVPFELGTFFVQQEARRVFGAMAPRVKGRVRDMRGTMSGGTAASAKATFDAVAKDLSLIAILNDPFALTPGFGGAKQPRGNKPAYEEDLQSWTAPFMMALINTRNVHRSNMLMGFAYGKEFVYDEMVLTGAGEKGEKQLVIRCAFTNFGQLQSAIEGRGLTPISAESEYVPTTHSELPEEQATEVMKLVDALEQDEDVQRVFHNLA